MDSLGLCGRSAQAARGVCIGKYAQALFRMRKYAQAVLGKKKAPRRALVFCVRFSRVRGVVVSAELMGQFS